jgi:hypothetical protein
MSQVHGYTPATGSNAIPCDDSVGITTFSYNIERIRDGHGNYYEVAVDPKVKNIIEALMKGYRYHRRPSAYRGMSRQRYS